VAETVQKAVLKKFKAVHEEKAWLSFQPGFFIVEIIAAF
jgi:hypothetical protein